MRIRVLYFASLARDVGKREAPLELPAGATVADALRQLTSNHAAIRAFGDRLAIAVNSEYVGAEHLLRDGDELALIPPVSGG